LSRDLFSHCRIDVIANVSAPHQQKMVDLESLIQVLEGKVEALIAAHSGRNDP